MPDGTENPASADTEVAQLLVLSARGDESAWRRLIDCYGRRVFAMARSRCRRDDLAEEITQSVFVTVATKITGGAYSEQGRFESWLFRITMNRVRDEVRRQRRQAAPADPLALGGVVAQTAAPAGAEPGELNALRSGMDELSEPDREIIELRHHAGMSFKQIADMLEEPMGTVLARHHRALRKLKECIEAASARSRSTERGMTR